MESAGIKWPLTNRTDKGSPDADWWGANTNVSDGHVSFRSDSPLGGRAISSNLGIRAKSEARSKESNPLP